jgi:hypothetical protein
LKLQKHTELHSYETPIISTSTSHGFIHSWSFIDGYSFFLISGTYVIFLTRSATSRDFPSASNNVKPTQGGAAVAARRRHVLEIEDDGHLKDLVVIYLFVKVFCTVRCFS